ncbi:TPA: hypothetical protein HA246_07485 [Candidatus Woesearchaeota archaeon]|nr:hypothetical protein [Candidatus Woesearchaeota archaeon]
MLSLDNLQFKSSKDYYDYLMFQIQERLVAIDELKSANKSFDDVLAQVSDLAVLSKMLALNEGVDEQSLNQRLQELKGKVISS